MPDRLLDDFGREAVAAIADIGHYRWLRLRVTDGKPNGDVTMPAELLRALFGNVTKPFHFARFRAPRGLAVRRKASIVRAGP